MGLVIVRIVDLSSRRRVQLDDLVHCRLHLVLRQAQLAHYFLEMLVGEFLEIIGENTDGIDSVRGLLHAFQLNEEAFPQVPCADSRRVELLYDVEHVQHFFISGRDVHPERQVVHDAVNVPAQVSVIIQAAYYECRHVVLVLAQVPESELVHKALRETLLY